MQNTAEWAAHLFGDAAVNMLFSTAPVAATATTAGSAGGGSAVVNGAAQGALQLGGGAAMLGTVLVVVMWAYLAYQIVMILIKLIWTCEKAEFALGAKRELKTCVAVGGYCKSKALGYCVEKRYDQRAVDGRSAAERGGALARAGHGYQWRSAPTGCGGGGLERDHPAPALRSIVRGLSKR